MSSAYSMQWFNGFMQELQAQGATWLDIEAVGQSVTSEEDRTPARADWTQMRNKITNLKNEGKMAALGD